MKVIGLTGGIGSGKTTVARMFEDLGIPIYIADAEAKRLTNKSKIIRRKLIQLLGRRAYTKNGLNKKFVADKIFNDQETLQQVNAIIHPKVAQHFARWLKKQQAPYCIKEAAIIFENGSYVNCDATILVVAPKEVRLKRVQKRDNSSRKEIEARMANQWSDEEKLKLANYVIENTSIEATKRRVLELHKMLAKPSK